MKLDMNIDGRIAAGRASDGGYTGEQAWCQPDTGT